MKEDLRYIKGNMVILTCGVHKELYDFCWLSSLINDQLTQLYELVTITIDWNYRVITLLKKIWKFTLSFG